MFMVSFLIEFIDLINFATKQGVYEYDKIGIFLVKHLTPPPLKFCKNKMCLE